MVNAEAWSSNGVPDDTNRPVIEDINRALGSIHEILGPTWERILEADKRGKNASPRKENRHLLAVLADQAQTCLEELGTHRGFAYLPESVALRGIVHLLEDWRREPGLLGLLPAFEDGNAFRHGMVALAYAENARQKGWIVRWAPATDSGSVADLYLEDPRSREAMIIEVKSPDPFGGLLQPVSPEMARKGVERAWNSALRGARRQLPPDRESILVTGGPSLPFESLGVIRTAAAALLDSRSGNQSSRKSRGESRPLLHSIGVLTTWTVRSGPPLEQVGNRLQGTANIGYQMGCKYALNPHYHGKLAPPLLVSPEMISKESEGRHRSVGWPDRSPQVGRKD